MFQSGLVVVMSEEAVHKCLLGWHYYKKNLNFTRLHTTDFEKISFFFIVSLHFFFISLTWLTRKTCLEIALSGSISISPSGKGPQSRAIFCLRFAASFITKFSSLTKSSCLNSS